MRRATLSTGLVRGVAALAVSFALTACYTFQPMDPLAASAGEQVQLVLSGSSARGIAPSALMGETLVQGELIDLTGDSISVSVWIGQAYRGTPFEPVHQTYTFPRVELVRLEQRKLSKPRTALTTLGILGAIYVLIDRLGYLEDPNPPGNGELPAPPDNPFTVRY